MDGNDLTGTSLTHPPCPCWNRRFPASRVRGVSIAGERTGGVRTCDEVDRLALAMEHLTIGSAHHGEATGSFTSQEVSSAVEKVLGNVAKTQDRRTAQQSLGRFDLAQWANRDDVSTELVSHCLAISPSKRAVDPLLHSFFPFQDRIDMTEERGTKAERCGYAILKALGSCAGRMWIRPALRLASQYRPLQRQRG